MAQRVEFDGQVHEFPDDFSQSDIGKALKMFPTVKSASSGPNILDDKQEGTGNRFVDSFIEGGANAINPVNWLRAIKDSFTDNPISQEHFDQAQKLIDASHRRGGSLMPFLTGKEDGTMEDYLGNASGGLAAGALIGGLVHGASRLGSKIGEVEPSTAIVKAVKPRPANPEFLDDVGKAMGFIKQAEVPGLEPIHFNPKTVDPNVATNNLIPTIQRAKAGAMTALDTYLDPLRRSSTLFDGNQIADSMEKTIPQDLKIRARVDPAAAQEIKNIKLQTQGFRQNLTTDEIKQGLIETNAQLNSLYHGTPDAQAAAINAAGGKAMLEAKASAYRKLLYDKAGPQAAELNKIWGILDDHEAAAQARRIPVVSGEMSTGPEETLTKLADVPGKFAQGKLEDIRKSFEYTDSLVRRAYEKTKGAGAYPRYQAPQAQLPAGAVVTPAPANPAGPINPRLPVNTMAPSATTRALPPATTILQGDVSPGSGGGVERGFGGSEPSKTLPTKSDNSGVRLETPKGLHEVAANDAQAIKSFGRAYSRLNDAERNWVDKIRQGKEPNGLDLKRIMNLMK